MPFTPDISDHKVVFNPTSRRIIVKPGVTSISVKTDLYSAWKEWLMVDDNSKHPQAFRAIGGDPIGSGRYAGDIYFLMNAWQVEINHFVQVEGALYHDDGILPFVVNPSGGVISTVSNLVQTVGTSGSGGLTPAQDEKLDRILRNIKTAIALSA